MRSNSLFKNGIASIIQKGLRVIDQFFLIPFFIFSWGAEYYGEYLTLTIIPSILLLSDFGFGTAAGNSMVKKYASGDLKGAAEVSKNGLLIITMTVFFGFLLTFLLLLTFDYFDLLSKTLIEKEDVIVALLLLMLSRLFNFFQQFFDAYYRCVREASKSMNLISLYTVSNLLGTALVLILNGRIVEVALFNFVISIVFNPIFAFLALRKVSLPKVSGFNKYLILGLAKNGFGFLLSPLWQSLYFQGTTLIVRILLGPLAVTVFNTARSLSRIGVQGYSIFISAIYPDFQFELSRGNVKQARNLFYLLLIINLSLGLVIFSFLFLFGIDIYQVWTKGEIELPTMVWNTFLLSMFMSSVWWSFIFIFQAANKPFAFTLPCILSSIISIIASYILTIRYGILGSAMGYVVLDFLLIFIMVPSGVSFLKLNLNNFRSFFKFNVLSRLSK